MIYRRIPHYICIYASSASSYLVGMSHMSRCYLGLGPRHRKNSHLKHTRHRVNMLRPHILLGMKFCRTLFCLIENSSCWDPFSIDQFIVEKDKRIHKNRVMDSVSSFESERFVEENVHRLPFGDFQSQVSPKPRKTSSLK